mmetsp:Transcript_25696/g.39816  ORF Transcript_25696/g.39816 Transcript_25696/m.39816 type:complete len:295 (+) Transcript_25696:449-1333(+)
MLLLTAVPLTQFDVILKKYHPCDVAFDNPFEVLESAVVEFEVDTGIMRTADEIPWKAVAEPYHNALYNASLIDEQFGEWVNYTVGSEIVSVSGGPFDDDLVFELPGFIAPLPQNDMYYGLEAFYSKNLKRIYFVYAVENEKDEMATCDTVSGICDFSGPLQEYSGIDRSPDRSAAVYDSMQLVGLPVVCCLCIDYRYYQYNESAILREILNPAVVDPRNSVAYASAGYDGEVRIHHQNLEMNTAGDGDIAIVTVMKGSKDDGRVFTESASFIPYHMSALMGLTLFSSCIISLLM